MDYREIKTYAINKGGLNQFDIIRSYREVNRPGTHITNESRPAIGNCMLDIQVPVQHVRAMRIRINHAITNTLPVEIQIGVRGAGAQRGVLVGADDLKWRGRSGIEAELVRKRKHIEDAETGAHGGLAVFAWIPGKANARFIVQCCGVVGDRTAGSDRAASSGARSAIEKRLNLL